MAAAPTAHMRARIIAAVWHQGTLDGTAESVAPIVVFQLDSHESVSSIM